MRSAVYVIASLLSFASALPKSELVSRQAFSNGSSATRPETYTKHSFDQLIDHFPDSTRYPTHTSATFSQKYVVDNTYWSGDPDAPVFLYIGGEIDISFRYNMLQTGIMQILMNATGGLGVVIENRYYGESYPFENSTVENLQYLTTEQSVAD